MVRPSQLHAIANAPPTSATSGSEANLADLDRQSLDRAGAEVNRAKDRLTATSDRTKREQAEIDREMARSGRDNRVDG
ncbi:hypothetical protein SAMN05421837_102984 [Amycolatopsis pretoriensis]|uniref:Uncharacterized protein n=1 Tax=Amycolatopsis pretoriensis TaxID=218821 RepID=A0A1H5QG45_9PSEU|nr:hypothetical protein [Amycolatopsis pretoriensis]SEF25045.1 hypothetical protein SAMN05421837_102984 [Amycolatopsis pretoriensis]